MILGFIAVDKLFPCDFAMCYNFTKVFWLSADESKGEIYEKI